MNINEEIIDQTIELRKVYKTKLPDAIIAATALVHGMTLISRNASDFKNISGLKLVDAHTL
jgi:predicted nucleic acid-binding protein